MLSDLVVCYLFLGGAGAGLCLVTSVLGLLSPRALVAVDVPGRRGAQRARLHPSGAYRRLLAPGFGAAFVALALGSACLAVDLGNAERAVLLFVAPRLSFVTVGAWALAALVVLAALLCTAWAVANPARAWSLALVRVLEVLAVAVALVVMVYTGLLLQSMAAVPLWASPWVPALFAASSLSCGTAAALGAAQLSGAAQAFGATVRALAAADAAIIVAEVLVVAAFVATLLAAAGTVQTGTDAATAASARQLLAGADAWLFWGVFAVGGMVAPLALDAVLFRARRPLPLAALAAAGCALAGGFALRFCIVEAGAHPVLAAAGVL